MAKPILHFRGVAANRTTNVAMPAGTNFCELVLLGRQLNPAIDHTKVHVNRTTPGHPQVAVNVQSARVAKLKGADAILIIKTDPIPRTSYGDSEEITVTVDDPSGGPPSDDATLDVVFYTEE